MPWSRATCHVDTAARTSLVVNLSPGVRHRAESVAAEHYPVAVVATEIREDAPASTPKPPRPRPRFRMSAAARARWQAHQHRKTLPKERPPREPVDLVDHHERAKSLRQYLIQNAVPLASLAIFAFIILKVLLVSDANINTALAIVERAGTFPVIAGVIVLAVPTLATGLNNSLAIWAGADSKFNRFERRRLWVLFSLSILYLSYILPWMSTLTLLAFGAFYVLRWFWRRRKVHVSEVPATTDSTPTFDVDAFLKAMPEDVELRRLWKEYKECHTLLTADPEVLSDQAVREKVYAQYVKVIDDYNTRNKLVQAATRPTIDAAAIALLLTVTAPMLQQSLNGSMWLPPELISAGSHGQVVGYVLNDSPKWTTILRDSDRSIVTLPTEDLTVRQVCRLRYTDSQTVTIYSLGHRHKVDYPLCPVNLPPTH